jgi:hypothetical protein
MSDPKFQLERVRAPVTDEELIEDIQRVAELAGTKVVSFRLYSEVGNYHPTTAALRFGTWNKALLGRRSGTHERTVKDGRPQSIWWLLVASSFGLEEMGPKLNTLGAIENRRVANA